MTKCLRTLALTLSAMLGIAGGALADSGNSVLVYTPGYFLDVADRSATSPLGYHDYALEKSYGVTPSISPYDTGAAILDWTGYNTRTYRVKDAGRYVDSWNFIKHGRTAIESSLTGHPKTLAVTYAMLANVPGAPTEVDIVPLLKMMDYTLAYSANGGEWPNPPAATTLIWSNEVTFATSYGLSREGYSYLGWNTQPDGSGVSATPGLTCYGGETLGLDDNHTNVTLYAQWQANDYPLLIRLGKGIAAAYWAVGGAATPKDGWNQVTGDADLDITFGTNWFVYAVAKPGYTYTTTSRDKPQRGTMTVEGAYFEAEGAANAISVVYKGNGATSGSTSGASFTYDSEGSLAPNGFTRAYTVRFNANGSGVTLPTTSSVAEYAFAGWNSAADGGGKWSYADQETVTNVCDSTGGNVTLYAQWTPGSVTLPAPVREGYTILGWYADAEGTVKVGDAEDEYTPTRDTTLYAQWEATTSTLTLKYGTGIARIYYRLGDAKAWTPVAEDSTLALAYGMKWSAYAVAKSGYSYATATKDRPQSGTARGEDMLFAPEATAKSITVIYDGNGTTYGATATSTFAYDKAGSLSGNTFTRTYRVSYYANGGTLDPATEEVTYTFSGWNTEPDGSGESFASQATVTNLCGSTGGDVTLYAQWTGESATVVLPRPTLVGRTFLGWYADAAFTYFVGDAGETFTPTKSVTLYAKWETKAYELAIMFGKGVAAVHYRYAAEDAEPGEWNVTNASAFVQIPYNARVYAYADAMAGYSYTTYTEARPWMAVMGVEGKTFAPEATPNTISVIYDGNGQTSGAMATSRMTYDQEDVLSDNNYIRAYTVTLEAGAGASVTPSSLVGTYTFTGWNSAADGTGVAFENHAVVTNICGSTGGNVTLYAQWTNVTAAVILPEPVRDGATFLGWTEKGEGARLWKAGEEYLPTGNVTLMAQWVGVSYTVTFVDGYDGPGSEGRPTIKSESVAYGEAATPPTPPAHAGYQFSGWDSSHYTKVTEDMTIAAQYKSSGYHVTYNSNYGSGATEQSVNSAGCGPGSEQGVDSLQLLDVGDSGLRFSKKGYRFLGWSWSAGATNGAWKAGTAMAWNNIYNRLGPGNTANLYAIWEPISYTVVYAPGFELAYPEDYEGGATNQTLVYDQPERLLKNPFTLDHQRFLGWQLKDGTLLGDQAEVTNLTATADDVITLTAAWDGNGDHTVVFDGNGADSGEMTAQLFRGTNEEYLVSNCFTRAGYTFAGWTTDLRSDKVDDRSSFWLADDTPRHSTNTFYAAWNPIRYTIIFNSGTNDVSGTIEPITCAYGELPHELPNCGETNFVNQRSSRFEGWALDDGTLAATNKQASAPCELWSDITSVDDDCVTLHAVWAGVGELSDAVGLTNATLVADKSVSISTESSIALWKPASPTIEVNIDPLAVVLVGYGEGDLHMTVHGEGCLSFKYSLSNALTTYEVRIDNVSTNNLNETTEGFVPIEIPVSGDGDHDIRWILNGNVSKEYTIALSDIRWIPAKEAEPIELLPYTISYEDQSYTYYTTNETFDISSVFTEPKRDGYTFAGWSPSKIEKYTTGDINVKALWKKIENPVTATFKLEKGLRLEGSASSCTISAGDDVTLPKVVVADSDYTFTGWYDEDGNLVSRSSVRVEANMTLTAKSEPVLYRIDYDQIPVGVVNTNPTGFTVEDLDVELDPLANTSNLVFTGWSPSAITKTGDATVTASWSDIVYHTVTFALGDHVSRTGGGALVQDVRDGTLVANMTQPEIQADEGYEFLGWDGATTITRDETLTAKVAAKEYTLLIEGVTSPGTYHYGDSVTAIAPFDVLTEGDTNIVCIGWTGTGCVPASGIETQVTFTVTGDGTLVWNYETNTVGNVVTNLDSDVTVDLPEASTNDVPAVEQPSTNATEAVTGGETAGGETAGGETAATGDESADEATTNFYVNVQAATGGSVQVLDPAGGICATTSFEAPTGSVLTAIARADQGWHFAGWAETNACEATLAFTVDGPVTLTANFTRVFSVRFEPGEHLVQSGNVPLAQSVVSGGVATEPAFVVDEGCTFNGWRVDAGELVTNVAAQAIVADTVFTADVTVGEHALSLGGEATTAAYGEVVTASAPFAEETDGTTNVVCLGWTATGLVPSSGTATEVSFTVTGDVTLDWLYRTNYWVSVRLGTADADHGAVAVLDPAGGLAATNEFWAAAGTTLSAVATAARGWHFLAWEGTNETCTVDGNAIAFGVKGPVDLTARLAENEPEPEPQTAHTVVFGLDGHLTRTGGGMLVQTVEYGEAAMLPTVSASTGYAFDGWYVDGVRVTAADLKSVTADLVVEGREKRTLMYVDASVTEGGEWKGSVSGGDRWVKPWTSVTVTATANTGCLFMGWFEGDEEVSTSARYTFTMPEADVALKARFITKEEDAASIRASLNGMALVTDGEAEEIATNVTAGVYLSWPVAASAETTAKVTVTGLPSGLKFSSRDYTIYGVPTAGGRTSTTKVTVTTTGKSKVIAKLYITVEALPTALVGTYKGGSTNLVGSATVTLARTGRISGKWISGGKTWTVSATGLDAYEDGVGVATATAKNGKNVEAVTLRFAQAAVAHRSGEETPPDIGRVSAWIGDAFVADAYYVNWKVEPWKTRAARYRNQTFDVVGGEAILSGKVGLSGAVTVTGTFDVGAAKPYTAKATGTLVPLGSDVCGLFVYFPPKTAKGFAGYAAELVISFE